MKFFVLSIVLYTLTPPLSFSTASTALVNSEVAFKAPSQFELWIPEASKGSVHVFTPYDPPGKFRAATSYDFALTFGNASITSKALLGVNNVRARELFSNKDLLAELISVGSAFIWWKPTKSFATHHRSWIAVSAQDFVTGGPNVFIQSYECNEVVIIVQSPLDRVDYEDCKAVFAADGESMNSYSNCVTNRLDIKTVTKVNEYLGQFRTYVARCH